MKPGFIPWLIKPGDRKMSKLPVHLLQLLAKLPLPFAHAMGLFLGWLLILIPNKNRRIAKRNLELCLPELNFLQCKKSLNKSLIETGKAVMEKGAIMCWKREKVLALVREVVGLEYLEAADNKDNGTILAIPHLGDWEMVGLYCSSRYPMTSLYRPLRGPLDNFIKKGRERLGAHLVPTKGAGLRALYSALDKGELVAILPDQNPGAGKGIYVPFFGIKANTMVLLSRLATKTNATVLYAYAERLPAGKGFCLHFSPTPDELHDQNIIKSLTALNAGLEKCIRTLPEQYWWSYPRFRHRPEGEQPIY